MDVESEDDAEVTPTPLTPAFKVHICTTLVSAYKSTGVSIHHAQVTLDDVALGALSDGELHECRGSRSRSRSPRPSQADLCDEVKRMAQGKQLTHFQVNYISLSNNIALTSYTELKYVLHLIVKALSLLRKILLTSSLLDGDKRSPEEATDTATKRVDQTNDTDKKNIEEMTQ